MAPFAEHNISSVAEYAVALEQLPNDRTLWYRGQTNARWRLVPSLQRKAGTGWVNKEGQLLTRFRQNARPLVPSGAIPESEWDWLLLMQHYGVATRLLDWSESALVGLYFAVTDVKGPRQLAAPGCVWVLDPVGLNGESAIGTLGEPIPTFGADGVLSGYSPSGIAQSPVALLPAAALAIRIFPRLVAQSGVFTIAHRLNRPIQQIANGTHVGKITVSPGAKERIRRELTRLGITRLTLFPELESVADLVEAFVK